MLLSNIFTRSGIFRHLFVVLHLRWIHSITNSSAYNYQTLAKWNFEIYQSQVFRIFTSFFDIKSDIITAIFNRQMVVLNSHQPSAFYYKRNDYSHKRDILMLSTFVSKNTRQFGWLEGLTLWLTSTSYFYHEQSVSSVMLNAAQ